MFNVILEVAFILRTAGLLGLIGQTNVMSLLEWYRLDQELVLVKERPTLCMDFFNYHRSYSRSLDEHEAKMILKQPVDAAIDIDSKDVFDRDNKLQNVLVKMVYMVYQQCT